MIPINFVRHQLCVLFNNFLFESQLSHCRDYRVSSNGCLAFIMPVRNSGWWHWKPEPCLGEAFIPLTDRKGRSFTLSFCLCPGNKPILVKTGVPGAVPVPIPVAIAVGEGAGQESGCYVGSRGCWNSLQGCLESWAVLVGKVTQKWKFGASSIGEKAAFCIVADLKRR